MKTLGFLCLSLAVALGIPVLPPGEEQDSTKSQGPLLGDRLPVQGHVVVENPASQAFLSLEEHQERVDPVQMKQSESTEDKVKVKPEDKEAKELKPEVKQETDVKVEEAEEVEQGVNVDEDIEAKKLQIEPELQVETVFKVDEEVKEEVKMEKEEEPSPEVKVGGDFEAEEADEPVPEGPVDVEAKAMEPELQAEPDFKVESEIKVEPDVQMELEPEEKRLLTEAREKPEMQMRLESENNPGEVTEEWHIDMEGQYEAMGETHVELEPLDDDSLFENEAIQEAQALTEEEEKLRNDVLNEEIMMELEPEMIEEPLPNQDVVPDAADLEEETALDMAGQQMSLSENHYPEEEAGMKTRYVKQEDSVDEEEYLMMLEEARRGATREENSQEVVQQVEEEGPQTDVMSQSEQNAWVRQEPYNQEWRHCPGVLLEEKCYQFFKDPKNAADAEFFCQEHFPKGHLASITNQTIHRELMSLILKENGGYTRTWVGGIRYLDTNRFAWLDGSHWSYADWLSGEPNNTLGVEDCVEVLAFGNGKFNDFTCWEPQPFLCSYSNL